MVGVTGIEPVTPTMSTSWSLWKPAQLREKSTTHLGISGNLFPVGSWLQVHCAKEHYVQKSCSLVTGIHLTPAISIEQPVDPLGGTA